MLTLGFFYSSAPWISNTSHTQSASKKWVRMKTRLQLTQARFFFSPVSVMIPVRHSCLWRLNFLYFESWHLADVLGFVSSSSKLRRYSFIWLVFDELIRQTNEIRVHRWKDIVCRTYRHHQPWVANRVFLEPSKPIGAYENRDSGHLG